MTNGELPKEIEAAMSKYNVTIDDIIEWAKKTPKYEPYTYSESGLVGLAQLYFELKHEEPVKFESYTFRGSRTPCNQLSEGKFCWIQVLVGSTASRRTYRGCPVNGCQRGAKQVGSEYFCEEHGKVPSTRERHWNTYWGSDDTETILISAPPSVSDQQDLLGGTWKLTGKLNDEGEFVARDYMEVDPEPDKFSGHEHIPEKKVEKPKTSAPATSAPIPESRQISDNHEDELSKDLNSFDQMIFTFAKDASGMPLERVQTWANKYHVVTPIEKLLEMSAVAEQAMLEDGSIIIRAKQSE